MATRKKKARRAKRKPSRQVERDPVKTVTPRITPPLNLRRFYLVLSEKHTVTFSGGYNFVRFATEGKAREVAAKLARQHGCEFHVLERITGFKPAETPVVETDVAAPKRAVESLARFWGLSMNEAVREGLIPPGAIPLDSEDM